MPKMNTPEVIRMFFTRILDGIFALYAAQYNEYMVTQSCTIIHSYLFQ